MSQAQMQVFNSYIMPAVIETLDEMVTAFNAASGGSILLTTEGFDGNFLQESFYQSIHTAQRRVNRDGANGSVSATDLSQLQKDSVKVAGGFGPIRYEPSQMTWLNKSTAEGIEVASRNFAEAMLRDQLYVAIASLVAAIENQSDLVEDQTGNSKITQRVLNNAHARFGDRSQSIVAHVMDGTAFHTLIDQNLANDARLFVAGNVQVIDILGRAFVVTDAPALKVAGGTPQSKVLGLVNGAAVVHDAGDVISNIETTNGLERIETTMQVDYTFGVGLKGYSWDTANGGSSPSDVALGTGTNWDKVATSDKDTAGVLAIGDL